MPKIENRKPKTRGCPDPPDDAPDPVILPGGRIISQRGRGCGTLCQSPAGPRFFKFPADHGAHPDFKTEWWYWVGHLKSPQGEAFGYQITFFRAALRRPDPRARSAWSLDTVYFAHLAVTDPTRGRFRFR